MLVKSLSEVMLIEQRAFYDERGFFSEVMRESSFNFHSVQINQSRSKRGVIRGIHFQNPKAQGKLIHVISGRICDVVVDLRVSSPTFMQHMEIELDESDHRLLYVPRGFGHGFSVLSDEAHIIYCCDEYYAPECEHCIAFDDEDLKVNWHVDMDSAVVSPKDSAGVSIKDAQVAGILFE